MMKHPIFTTCRALQRLLPLCVLALVVCACSREEGPLPSAPARSAPWPATGPSATADSVTASQFRVEANSYVSFEVSRRKAKNIEGVVRVVEGELTIDLDNLQRSRGNFRFDLGSIELKPLADAGPPNHESALIHNWLDIGSSRPEVVRERLRWARYEVTGISALSAPSASRGASAQKAGETKRRDAAALDTADLPSLDRRSVTLRALGNLELHSYRVSMPIDLRVTFEFPEGPGAVDAVSGIEIETTKPFNVSLRAHDVRARDTLGHALSNDEAAPFSNLSSVARVSVKLRAKAAGRRRLSPPKAQTH